MHDGIAQQVLDGRSHALQHVAVELALHAGEHRLGVLALFLRGLPHHALQTRHLARERHHQGAHQALLDGGVDATLLQQQTLGLIDHLVHQHLHGSEVVDRLGERTGELLHARVAVHLQRIEVLPVLVGRGTGAETAGGDLRLGLDVEHAQLLAQADDGLGHFPELRLQRGVLLLQTRAVDGDLAGLVEHGVQRFHRHAGQLAAHRGLVGVLFRLPEQLRPPAQRRLGAHRRQRHRLGQRRGFEFQRRVGRQRLGIAHGDGVVAARQGIVQVLHRRQLTAQRRMLGFAGRIAPQLQAADLGLQIVGEIAHVREAGHARATLEGVQRALQLAHGRLVARVAAPGGERAVDGLQHLGRLGDEDVGQLRIDLRFLGHGCAPPAARHRCAEGLALAGSGQCRMLAEVRQRGLRLQHQRRFGLGRDLGFDGRRRLRLGRGYGRVFGSRCLAFSGRRLEHGIDGLDRRLRRRNELRRRRCRCVQDRHR